MAILTREAMSKKLQAGEPVKGDVVVGARATRSYKHTREDDDKAKAKAKERFGDELLGRVVPFVFATKGRKDDGIDLSPKGVNSEEWDRAPMVLWAHRRWVPRIADGMILEADDDEVRGLVCFYPREFSEALDGGLSYALGELSAHRGHRGSIGFDVTMARLPDKKVLEMNPWAIDGVEWAIREFSVLNFGMDSDSISAGRAGGVDVEPIARALEVFLDDVADVTGVDRKQLEGMWRAASAPRPLVSAPSLTLEEVRATVRESMRTL